MIQASAERLCEVLRGWLRELDQAGDAHLYTQEEWRARDEPFGNEATAVLVIDGSVLYQSANFGEPITPYKEFRELLEELGYRDEFGFAWSLNIYPVEGEL